MSATCVISVTPRCLPKYRTLATACGVLACTTMRSPSDEEVLAYIPMPDHRHRKHLFSDEDFQYNPDLDRYICPAREILPRSSFDRSRDVYMYRTSAKICQTCALKTQCTSSSYARVVTRSLHQPYIDRVRAYHSTEDYAKAQRKRAVWVEPMFAEAKQWHQLRRFRLRGLLKVNIQALLTAAGQNLKRILNLSLRKPTPNWPNLVALGLPHQSFHEALPHL